MTVLEVVKKYDLANFSKHYENIFGEDRDLLPINDLMNMEVKSISLNFFIRTATIIIATFH